MYLGSFFLAFLLFVILTFFVYFNYPASWRRNTMFNVVLIIWHSIGITSVGLVFTTFKKIPHEGIKFEIVRIGTYYYIMLMLTAIFFALRLTAKIVFYLFMKKNGRQMNRRQTRWMMDKRVHSIVFLVLAYAMCTAGFFGIDILHDTGYDVRIDKEAAEKELTVVLIADIHAGSGNWDFTYEELRTRIDRARPDVLLIAGDVFDETTSGRDVELVRGVLQKIRKPRYGMFFVYGNHDDATEDWAADQMRQMGVTVLEDEMTILGKDVQLVGRLDPKQKGAGVEALLETLDPDPDKPILLLTHRPKDFKKMSRCGVDLAVAGHTHGFNIPQFLGSNLLGDMYYGIRKYGGMTAITTSGISAWGFHYKFPAISEVVTIRLHFR